MNRKQMERIRTGQGFIAALDQSGGSTPKALQQYGIEATRYSGEEEMFTLVHEMRTRIIQSPSFDAEFIIGAILFENTMDRKIDGLFTADYLWEKKGIVPFLKIDKGLADSEDGVQVLKPIPDLDGLLRRTVERNIFGTKMRSVIHAANPQGIGKVVEQQFELGKQIWSAGLVPIIEPEVDINSVDKGESERMLKDEILKQLSALAPDVTVMLKLSIPTEDDFYRDLMAEPHVARVVALSGGYDREEANERLARSRGLIASFSRALAEGLSDQQSDEQFNEMLTRSIRSIYKASIS
ncbi:fructose bisphosphate aldolase [Paenibacillus anseongense]|uniref:fructose bisphosphate aldolase n=1 Tax=Paenibacillus anseongense TaxID=2682845 RepID=UPI002DB87D16|nr:fructose bisphosphate aldolase [Paenibacillus anseongense]MEC0264715.1 fructose bisphosphate aldolase [Paenibacillus anseongense]